MAFPPKHKRQVKDYILNLTNNPRPADIKPFKNYNPYVRGDIGEYRVVFRYDKNPDFITIVLVGKRNDGDVYKRLNRLL